MQYIQAEMIRRLREKRGLTQKELADRILVSDKTVSKWETGKGLPDIGILEDLAKALGISVAELLAGECKVNENVSANMSKGCFYVCPVCGNIIFSVGSGSFSCCGVMLPKLEVEPKDTDDSDHCNDCHDIRLENTDGELYVTMDHPMKKKHYISFVAYVTSDGVEIRKLYPEQSIEVRFGRKGHGWLYAYCNRHGLYRIRL